MTFRSGEAYPDALREITRNRSIGNSYATGKLRAEGSDYVMPDGQKELISKANLGLKRSDETRARMSASHRVRNGAVSAGGVTYKNTQEVADALKMNILTVRYRLKSNSATFRDWFYLKE